MLLNLGVHEPETTKDVLKSKVKHCEHHRENGAIIRSTGTENGEDQNVERSWNHNSGLRLLIKC